MEIAYICSPYQNNPEENTRNTKLYCRDALRHNFIPLAVHLHFPLFLNENDPAQRALGLRCGLELLRRCDIVMVYGDRISKGMKHEIAEAERLDKPIYYMGGNENEK